MDETIRQRVGAYGAMPPDDCFSIPVPALVEPKVCASGQAQWQEQRRQARHAPRGALSGLQGVGQCQHWGEAADGKRLSPSARPGQPRAYASSRCRGPEAYRFGGERLGPQTHVRTEPLDVAGWREGSPRLAHPERLAAAYRRRVQPASSTKPPARATVEAHLGKRCQGRARLMDRDADGLMDTQECVPHILRLRRRSAQAAEPRQQRVAAGNALQTAWQMLIGRLEDCAVQGHLG